MSIAACPQTRRQPMGVSAGVLLRRLRRWSVVLTCVVLLWLAPRLVCRAPLRSLVLRWLLGPGSGRLSMGSLSAGWLGCVRVDRLRYRSRRLELTADRVEIEGGLLGMLAAPGSWGTVRLYRPELTVLVQGAGRERSVPAGSASGRAAAAVTSALGLPVPKRVEVHAGRLSIAWPGRRPEPVAEAIELVVAARRDRPEASFRLRARCGGSGAFLTGHGQLDWPARSWHTAGGQGRLRLVGLRLAGLECSPVELAGRWRGPLLALQLRASGLGGGSGLIRARPVVHLDQARLTLRGPCRVADGLAIGEQVAELALRHVDPLFAVPGSLKGSVTIEVQRLEFPLHRDGLRCGRLRANLRLERVRFRAGSSLRRVLELAGLEAPEWVWTGPEATVRLDGDRVYLSGLYFPIGRNRATLDGWVALDRTVRFTLGLPVTPHLVGNNMRLYRMVEGKRIRVPITGTLERMYVPDQAIARNVQRLFQIALCDAVAEAGYGLVGTVLQTLR